MQSMLKILQVEVYYDNTLENSYGRKAICVQDVLKGFYTKKFSSGTPNNPHRRKAIQLRKVWQVLLRFRQLEETWEGPHWRETIQVHKVCKIISQSSHLKTHERTQTGENHSDAQSVRRAFPNQVILRHMRDLTQERNLSFVKSVGSLFLTRAIL